MNKFIRYAAAGLGFLAGAQASTEADASTCRAVNFYNETSYITQVNSLIDVATSILPTYLVAYDPLVLTEQTLSVLSFSALGYSFQITPVLNTLNVTGIKNIKPRHINVTGSNTLDIGTDFSGTLAASGTLTFNIAQLDHKWYQICWTDVLHPATCPNTSVGFNFAGALVNPSVAVNAVIDLVGCPVGSTAATCSDVSLTSVLVALLSAQYTAILNRILLRFKDVSLNSLSLGFDSISALSFSFNKSSTLINSLAASLLNISKDAINKKGDVYETVIKVLDTLLKSLLNNVITSDLEPKFGATCYE